MARVNTTKRILMVANVIALVGLSGATTYLFLENRNLNSDLNLSTTERQKKDNDKILGEIGKLINLPTSEPTVIKINNPDDVKKSEGNLEKLIVGLFDDLKADDYVIFYLKDRQAVQYRPGEKKIIKTTQVALPIVIELIGSESAMLSAEEALKQFGEQITVIKTKTEGITQNFVFDVEQNQQAETSSIAKELNYEIGTTLPTGFTPGSQTEIVVAVSGAGSTTLPTTTEQATEQQP